MDDMTQISTAAADDFGKLFDEVLNQTEAAESQAAVEPVTNAEESSETVQADAAETPALTLEDIIKLAMGQLNTSSAEDSASPDNAEPQESSVSHQESVSEEKPESATKLESTDNEEEDEEETDADDWLSRLFRRTDTEEEETAETTQRVESKQTDRKPVSKSDKVSESDLQAKIRELEERLKVAEEVAQQVVIATQLRVWVDQAKEQAQQFQQLVRQQGIELTDETIENAMVEALKQIHQNPNALMQQLAMAAITEMAKQYSRQATLPKQLQTTTPSRMQEPKTFEDYLDLALQELSSR